MTERRDERGRLPLLRLGPFVPPIVIAGVADVLVTDDFRQRLAESGLRGFQFAEVWKKHIAKLDWRSWDLDADQPAHYPAGGEPENYVLGRTHDPATAEAIGVIWEVVIDQTLDDPGDADLVRSTPSPFSRVLASDVARTWFEANAAGWLRLEPAP